MNLTSMCCSPLFTLVFCSVHPCVLLCSPLCSALFTAGYELFPGDVGRLVCSNHSHEMGVLRRRKVDECCEEEGVVDGVLPEPTLARTDINPNRHQSEPTLARTEISPNRH